MAEMYNHHTVEKKWQKSLGYRGRKPVAMAFLP